MDTPSLYVIIVTYNAMRWAERCFTSLRKSSVPVRTIVVDNGSTDGTQDFIKANFPEVEFIQSAENLGFGKANNLGIEKAYKAGADFFYLMNQDAWIFEDSFEKLLEVYVNHPNKDEIGIISPMHLDGSERKLDIFFEKYLAIDFERTRIISDIFLNTLKNFYNISFINAAHWLLPKHTIDLVGGFNPYFFHYGEDNEYVNRINFHELKILIAIKSRVVHDGKQNLSKIDYTKYEDLSVDTKVMNPAYHNAFAMEMRAFRQSIFKNALFGNFPEVKKIKRKMCELKAKKKQLENLAAEVSKTGNTFLIFDK